MTFWKPGTVAPGVNIEREDETESNFVVYNPSKETVASQRKQLPVYRHRLEILYAIEKFQTVVVVGETGSGKTTQIPQYLHETGWTAGNRVVGCTQPRRVAATTVAQRVAEEMRVDLGAEVGYSIRFDDCCDKNRTRIKYLTDGMLLRETMSDPLLSQYSVIMLDEAHERSLSTEILLGLLKKIKKKRKDLRIVISSATLDATTFKEFFEDNKTGDSSQDSAIVIQVEGRQFPVDLVYSKRPVRNYIQGGAECVLYIHKTQPPGDILLFTTGKEEIERVVDLLHEADESLNVFPLYAGLPPGLQLKAFRRLKHERGRKVVVATNVAETSVTIPGIVYVIDTGFAKIKSYDPSTRMSSLLVAPISQASANQRMGRAGRMRNGTCYRLYTEESFFRVLPKRTVPEIQRVELSTVVLQLKALGIDDVLHFDFISPPPAAMLANALELLYSCGALNDRCKLTRPLGETLAEFPVDPQLARMLVASGELKCSEEIITIAAMLSVQSAFVIPKNRKHSGDAARRKFGVYEGDHLTMLNVYNSFLLNKKEPGWCDKHYLSFKTLKRAGEIRKQLRRYCVRFRVPMVSAEGDSRAIRRAIVCGYFANAAQLQSDGTFRTVRGNARLEVHPSSVLYQSIPPNWVIFHELQETNKKWMRDVTVVEPLWLSELAPHYYEYLGVQNEKKDPSVPPSLAAPAPPPMQEQEASSFLSMSASSDEPVQKKHRILF